MLTMTAPAGSLPSQSMNRFFWKSFATIEQSICSQLKLDRFPEKVQLYVRELVGTD